ncbi:quinone oxidoreductase [Pseudomaricurvus sp. HS19]|uniref:quinone oxidoreductase family protein n=1 Tax=Pseudomaricurvus sp. HS19 TaxID=2692626 RepID=UPI0013722B40|nr:quinone oxidoreductase [Pseudomaricurvus sp. HS19]MYM62193.1 zinc-binding dehydrogenase [Pseudomaricurvus sp. HS19]
MKGTEIQGFRLHDHGGPEVLQWGAITLPAPAGRQVLVRNRAVGVNFIDIYHREGLYPMALPSGLGVEGAGVVEAVGSEVTEFRAGDRVAYCMCTPGAYAEAHLVDASRIVRLPDAIDEESAAGVLLKGLTAAFLLHSMAPLQAGDAILVHAAAGGVGQLLCQWAAHKGLTVIAVVSTEAKAEQARSAGATHAIVGGPDGLAEQVRALTGGQGVRMALDSVGASTWEASLDSLARRGWYVTYGNASGPVPPIAPLELQKRGSLVMTRPGLADFVASREELDYLSGLLFDVLGQGVVKPAIGLRLPLAEAPEAQRRLQARETSGSIVLQV